MHEPGEARQLRADPDGHDRADEVLALAADVEHPAAEGERDREPGEDERHVGDQRLLEIQRREGVERRVPREPDARFGEGDPDLVRAHLEEPVEPGALEDRLVGRERVLPRRRQHDEAADEEREERRQQRHGDPAGLLPDREPGRDARSVVPALTRVLDLPAALRRSRARALGHEPTFGWTVTSRPSVGRSRADLRLIPHAASFRPPPVIATPSSSSETPGANSPTISPS